MVTVRDELVQKVYVTLVLNQLLKVDRLARPLKVGVLHVAHGGLQALRLG